MTIYDLYGLPGNDLRKMKSNIEKVLGLTLAVHDSAYHGGEYYRTGDLREENFVLQGNTDLVDGEAIEQSFTDVSLLLYVNRTDRHQDIEARITKSIEGSRLLRRESL